MEQNILSDPYFSTDLCVERLYNTYLKHKNIIVAVDHDDTLFDFHKKGYTFPKVIEIIKECNKLGFHVIIYTASAKERHPEILENAAKLGIQVTSINKNSIESPFGNDGKIFYNIFLCDRAGLGQSYTILRKTLDRIYKEIERQKQIEKENEFRKNWEAKNLG